MTGVIEPKLLSIKAYFDSGIIDKNRQLIIPEFQRAYSWEETQCDELWNDIEEQYGNSKNAANTNYVAPYFFGCIIYSKENVTITVKNTGDTEAPISDNMEPPQTKTVTEFKIIDGQQRTITFLLLIKAMELRVNEILSNENYDFSQDKKLKGALQSHQSELLGILYRNKNSYVREDWDNEVRKTNDYVIKTRSINEAKLASFPRLDLYNILNLEKYEDAENEESNEHVNILKKQGLSKTSPKRFSQFYRNFKYFYKKLDKTPQELNNWIEFFLTSCQIIEISTQDVGQAISMFNALNSKGMNLSDSDLVCSYLAAKAEKEDKAEEKEVEDSKINHTKYFEEKWSKFVGTVHKLSLTASGRDADEKEADKRKSILIQYMYYVRACDGVKDTTTQGVRSFYNAKIEKNELSTVNFKSGATCDALYKAAQIWEKILEMPVVKILLRFNHNAQYFLLSYLFKLDLDNVLESTVTPFAENLLRLFAIQTIAGFSYSDSNFKVWLLQTNPEFIKINNDNIINNAFREHINSKFDKSDIITSLKENIDNTLVFLHEYLYAKEKGFNGFDVDATTQVEHIMPQSGEDNIGIRRNANIVDEHEFRSYVNKLGNKILLEANINKQVSDHWFIQKKQGSVKQKAGYGDSKFPLAAFLKESKNDFWTKNDIDDATEKAANRIYKFIFQDD